MASQETMEISMEDFQKLQSSLLEYKQKAYDAEAATNKLKTQLTEAQNSRSSASSWFSSSNKSDALQTENDNLRRSVAQLKEEFAQQTQALKGNLRSLFEENESLRDQLQKATPTDPVAPSSEALEALQQQLTAAEAQAARLPALEAELATLRAQALTPPEPSEDLSDSHQAEIEALQKLVDEKTQQLTALQDRMASLDSTPLPAAEEVPSDALVALESEVEEGKKEVTRLQQLVEEKDQAHAQAQDQILALTAQVEEWKSQAQAAALSHAEETSSPTPEDAEKDESLQQLQNDLAAQGQRFGEQLDALNEQLAQLRQENLQLTTSLSQAQQERDSAQQSAEQERQTAAQAQEELALAQEDREAMISRITEKELSIDTQRDEISALQAQMQQLQEKADTEKKAALQSVQKQLDSSKDQSEILKQEILSLQNKLQEAEKEHQRQRQDMESNTEQVTDFQELVSLKSKQIQELRETISNLRDEIQAKEQAEEAARAQQAQGEEDMASLRTALEQMTERHDKKVQALNAMAVSKEEVVNQHRQVLDTLRAEHAEKEKELRTRSEANEAELTRLRKEHKELSQGNESSVQRLQSLEEQVATLTAQHQEEHALRIQWEKDAQEAQAALQETRTALTTAEEKIAEWEQKLQDVQMEHTIELKKSQRLIRDLQTRLQKAKEAPPPVAPASPALPAARALSNPTAAPASPVRTRRSMDATPANPPPPSVPQDVAAIGMKVGELQKRNFQLEEHIKQLRGTIQRYRKELDNKNRVIAYQHANLNPEGRSSAQMDAQRKQRATREQGLMGRLFGSAVENEEGLQNEINSRMSRVLEDTILKNVQLQSDMEIMGDEIARLEGELKALRETPSTPPPS